MGSSKVCKVNLSSNISLFSYIESLRKEKLLEKHVSLKVINNELNKIKSKYFTCVLFGSYVNGEIRKNSDIDLLFIIPDKVKIDKFELEVESVFKTLSYNIDVNVINEKSVKELLTQKKLNILNETVKKHIILHGNEQYYGLINDI